MLCSNFYQSIVEGNTFRTEWENFKSEGNTLDHFTWSNVKNLFSLPRKNAKNAFKEWKLVSTQ